MSKPKEIQHRVQPGSTQSLAENLIYSLVYFNGTGRDLFITTRDGISHRLTPNPMPTPSLRGKMMIRRVVLFTRQNQVILPDGDSEYLALMAELYENNHQSYKNRVSTEHIFDRADLEDKVHGYCRELDVVLSTESPQGIGIHPYSADYQAPIQTGIEPKFVAGVTVKIVDNSDQIDRRFMNLGGRIIEIKPVKDLDQKEGVYVTTRDPVAGKMVTEYAELFSHDFDKEKATGRSPVLYRSAEAARSLGDPDGELKARERKAKEDKLRIEAELFQRQQELEEFKAKFQMAQLQLQQEKAEVEDRLRSAEHQRFLERESVKDYYQQKSFESKESIEMLKVIPAILTGTMALYALFKKF